MAHNPCLRVASSCANEQVIAKAVRHNTWMCCIQRCCTGQQQLLTCPSVASRSCQGVGFGGVRHWLHQSGCRPNTYAATCAGSCCPSPPPCALLLCAPCALLRCASDRPPVLYSAVPLTAPCALPAAPLQPACLLWGLTSAPTQGLCGPRAATSWRPSWTPRGGCSCLTRRATSTTIPRIRRWGSTS